MEIEFKIATMNGVQTCRGELIEINGFQYALHVFDGNYKATELSTGMCVCGVSKYTKIVDGTNVRKWLLMEIEKLKITREVILRAKQMLLNDGLEFPLNERF